MMEPLLVWQGMKIGMVMGGYIDMMKPLPIWGRFEIIAHVDVKVSMHDEV